MWYVFMKIERMVYIFKWAGGAMYYYWCRVQGLWILSANKVSRCDSCMLLVASSWLCLTMIRLCLNQGDFDLHFCSHISCCFVIQCSSLSLYCLAFDLISWWLLVPYHVLQRVSFSVLMWIQKLQDHGGKRSSIRLDYVLRQDHQQGHIHLKSWISKFHCCRITTRPLVPTSYFFNSHHDYTNAHLEDKKSTYRTRHVLTIHVLEAKVVGKGLLAWNVMFFYCRLKFFFHYCTPFDQWHHQWQVYGSSRASEDSGLGW